MPDVPSTDQNVPAASLEVRKRLVEALNLDLIGPGAGHNLASERLPGWVRPSNWYLTGFLIPAGAPPEQSGDTDEDDDLDEMPESAGLAEESTEERKAAKKGYFPSSMGLSFLVPEDSDTVSATVRWADYGLVPIKDDDGKAASVWQREQNEHTEPVSLARAGDYHIADSGGLTLHVEVRPIDTAGIAGIPAGTRSVSVFLVNRRKPDEDSPDLAYAFQAEIEVQGERAFVPRPDLRGAQAEDWDDQVADLHYADTPEFATGHGVSADWDIVDGACRRLRTAWIPSASVEKTETRDVPAVELSMETLGALNDGAAAETGLLPLVDEYRAWIEGRHEEMEALQGGRRDTADGLLLRAAHAADRIERGIALLASNEDALDAFRVANRAVASALRRRLGEQFDDRQRPRWRAFQLAFIPLNLPGLADPLDPHRETVDLLFFPTGGGKTEAYLGLAAFTMVLRRLRNPGQNGVQGAGVSIIMRYTLRLLTLDQLAPVPPVWSARWNSNAKRTPRGTASGRSRSASGSARPRRPTSWATREKNAAIRRAPRPVGSGRTPGETPPRSRSRTVRGAGPGSSPTRSPSCPTTSVRRSFASSAPTSSATSAATGRCRSWRWTSPSTAASPPS